MTRFKIIPSSRYKRKKYNFLIIITLQTGYKITREHLKNEPHTERYDRFNCLMIHEL